MAFKKRTLQRRLDQLITDGRVASRGAGRGFLYLLPESAKAPPISYVAEPTPEYPVPYREEPRGDWLSPAAKELRASITRPLTERAIAPYDNSQLLSYQPNVTEYLPPPCGKNSSAWDVSGWSNIRPGPICGK